MKHLGLLLSICLVLPTVTRGQDSKHSAVFPEPRGGGWTQRAKLLNDRIKDMPDAQLLFIGDSITQGWEGAGAKIWEERYATRKAVNLGIGGDRTQHVLYRLENGNLEGVKPRAAVVMIGTNNSNRTDNTAEQIIDGVTTIISTLRSKTPDTKILLLAIFPRGENINEQRGKILQINQVLAKLDDGKYVHYLDIGPQFMNAQGRIPKDVMPDFLHLSPKGYQIWADAIEPTLEKWVGKPVKKSELAAKLPGNWTFTIEGPDGADVHMPMELDVDGDKVTGRVARGPDRWLAIEDGKIAGDKLTFTVKRDREGGGTMVYKLEGELVEGELKGSVSTEFGGESVTREWWAPKKEKEE